MPCFLGRISISYFLKLLFRSLNYDEIDRCNVSMLCITLGIFKIPRWNKRITIQYESSKKMSEIITGFAKCDHFVQDNINYKLKDP